VRLRDLVWCVLFAALIPTTPHGDAPEIVPLVALAVVQVAESHIPAMESAKRRIFWIVLKLALGYMLIGYTGGVDSAYWPVLLLPVVSAATALSFAGTLAFIFLAAGAYLSFLAWLEDWKGHLGELILRMFFLAIGGILVNALAEELRVQSRRYRQTAEQLAEANAQLRQAEEAVRRSDRLAALGQLSAGLAHELRNPLSTIRNSAELVGKSVDAENKVARECAGFITSEVDRVNSLVTRFLDFARPLKLRREKADLTAMLDRAVALAEREAPGIAIYRNYEPEIPPFRFDAELMERAIYNLVLNAAQVTAPGGAVTVKTRAAGGMAEIAVIDRGAGIDPRNRASIFNPFFTTKQNGVGLGLSIVSRIVDEHGGKIAVESEPGKGSVFRVLLPMDGAPTSSP
jgi:signal transduction histidine kinase